METCQHCDMYMKPFIEEDKDNVFRARCEFCDRTIATKIMGKWVKMKKDD